MVAWSTFVNAIVMLLVNSLPTIVESFVPLSCPIYICHQIIRRKNKYAPQKWHWFPQFHKKHHHVKVCQSLEKHHYKGYID
jgi:hypothetical protein